MTGDQQSDSSTSIQDVASPGGEASPSGDGTGPSLATQAWSEVAKNLATTLAAVAAGLWFSVEMSCPEAPYLGETLVLEAEAEFASVPVLSSSPPTCLVDASVSVRNVGNRSLTIIGYNLSARGYGASEPTSPFPTGPMARSALTWPPPTEGALVVDDLQSPPHGFNRTTDYRRLAPGERGLIPREVVIPADPASTWVRLQGRIFVLEESRVDALRLNLQTKTRCEYRLPELCLTESKRVGCGVVVDTCPESVPGGCGVTLDACPEPVPPGAPGLMFRPTSKCDAEPACEHFSLVPDGLTGTYVVAGLVRLSDCKLVSATE